MEFIMGGWRKFASNFVDFDDEVAEKVDIGDDELGSIDDVDDLLSQLDGGDTPAVITNEASLPGIQANKPFLDIYNDQGIVPAAKTAEEVLAILEGMSALPPEIRKISLDAMDAADNNWTMDDVHADAVSKQNTLGKYKAGLDVALSQSNTSMEVALQKQDTYMAETTKMIRDQIEALQAEIAGCQDLLQTEIVSATEAKSNIKSEHEAVVATHASECARIDTEIARLGTI